jgi:3-deoxy-D-manno-octulosonic-acid transferase
LAKSIGLTKSSVTGDTRFDRVKQLRERDNHVDHITDFIGKIKQLFSEVLAGRRENCRNVSRKNNTVKMIIAPHDLKRVEHLKSIFLMLYCIVRSASTNLDFVSQILIIDSIGLLSKLYSYADVAVVGGGFHDAGLHNILEAATLGFRLFLEIITKES